MTIYVGYSKFPTGFNYINHQIDDYLVKKKGRSYTRKRKIKKGKQHAGDGQDSMNGTGISKNVQMVYKRYLKQ